MFQNVMGVHWQTPCPPTANLPTSTQRIEKILFYICLGAIPVLRYLHQSVGGRLEISKGLPRQRKKDGHFAAMPYAKVPTFMNKVRERESFSRLALEFAILTAARSGEVRGATRHEIDLEAKVWTIPKDEPATCGLTCASIRCHG